MTKNRDHITERKLEIVKLIGCDEKTEYVEPDFDVYPIIDRCKRHIIQRLKRQVVKPPTLRSPQNQVVNWLQAHATQTDMVEVVDLLSYFSQPLPAVLLTQLRKLCREYRDDKQSVIVDKLRVFAKGNVVPDSGTAIEANILSEDDLQLICWLAIVEESANQMERQWQQARAAVLVTIEKVLDEGLPKSYTPELFEMKTTAVFQHVYDRYYGVARSVYTASA